MNCSGVRHLISAYLDEELDRGERLMVDQHLRRCHACADEADALRQTIALCASLDEVEVPADFRAGLRARLVALGPPAVAVPPRRPAIPAWRKNAGRWALPAAAAAAFAVAVGIGPYMADQIAPPVNPPVSDTVGPGSEVPVNNPTPVSTNSDPTPNQQPKDPVQENNKQASQQPVAETNKNTSSEQPVGTTVEPVTNTSAVEPVNENGATTATDPKRQLTTATLEPQYALSSELRLRVPDMQAALMGLKAVAAEFKGTVTEGSGEYDKVSRTYSGIVVNVPADQLNAFLAALKKQGTAVGGTVVQDDVAATIEQTKANLADRNEKLQTATGSDMATTAWRETLKQEIAEYEKTLTLYQHKVAFATVTVTLEEMVQTSRLH